MEYVFTEDYSFKIGNIEGKFCDDGWFSFEKQNIFNRIRINDRKRYVFSNRLFYYGSPGLLMASGIQSYYININKYIHKMSLRDALYYVTREHNFEKCFIAVIDNKMILTGKKLNGEIIELNDSFYIQSENELEEFTITNGVVLNINRGHRKYKLRGRYKLRDLCWED